MEGRGGEDGRVRWGEWEGEVGRMGRRGGENGEWRSIPCLPIAPDTHTHTNTLKLYFSD